MAYGTRTHARNTDKLRSDVDGLRIRTAVLVDSKPQGTGAGNAVTNAWTTRTINNLLHNDDNIVAGLASNVFTLRGGHTYRISALFPFTDTQETMLRIWNTTYNVEAERGQSFHFDNNTSGIATVVGVVTITRDTSYKIEYYCKKDGTNSLGKPANISGYTEEYGVVEINRLTGLKPD